MCEFDDIFEKYVSIYSQIPVIVYLHTFQNVKIYSSIIVIGIVEEFSRDIC